MDSPARMNRVRWRYHFTDTRNLSLIREFGGSYSTAKLREMGVENFHPGGNQWSLDADEMSGMDQYVHLCFKPNHPMEHIARQEGRIENSRFLPVDGDVLRVEGMLYSAGVSNKSGIEICGICEAADKIDYEVLYTWMPWSNPEIQARRQAAEKCEILVPDHVPMKYLEKYFPNG
jgi:ssDNA thymidine ADP-ribosyltransferase DarT-like protein